MANGLLARVDRKWARWALVLGWMGVIFFLSAQSRLPDLSRSLSDALRDILGHFIEYAVLAVLLHRALASSGVRRPVLWTLLIALVYALSDEFHQSFVPGRHPDPFDILVDMIGASAALIVNRLLQRRQASH